MKLLFKDCTIMTMYSISSKDQRDNSLKVSEPFPNQFKVNVRIYKDILYFL